MEKTRVKRLAVLAVAAAIFCFLTLSFIATPCSVPEYDPSNIPESSLWMENGRVFSLILAAFGPDTPDVLFTVGANYDSKKSFVVAWGAYPAEDFYTDAPLLINEYGNLDLRADWLPPQEYLRFLAWSPHGNVNDSTAPIYFYRRDAASGEWRYVMTSFVARESYGKPIVEQGSEFADLLAQFIDENGGLPRGITIEMANFIPSLEQREETEGD